MIGVAQPRYRRIIWAGIAVLLAALIVQTILVVRAERAEADRRDATEVAERVAIGLTSFHADDRGKELAKLKHDLTGALQRQVTSERALLDAMKDFKASSTSSVELAGVEAKGKKSCRVLVAVTARVKNQDAPTGEARLYRMRLTLYDVNGRWRASAMEMVP